MKRELSWQNLWSCCILLTIAQANAAEGKQYSYRGDDTDYRYSVIQTGENYTFKFDQSLPDNATKLKAGYQVLREVYRDDSIAPRHSQHYLRERARCYVFDSRFHTYTLCFLPNDFNRSESARFWVFVMQVPNWKWLATRILLPVVSAFAMVFYWARRKPHTPVM